MLPNSLQSSKTTHTTDRNLLLQRQFQVFSECVFQVFGEEIKEGNTEWIPLGSCFLYCNQWFALTCAHVVEDDTIQYAVSVENNTMTPVQVLKSKIHDLALLAIGQDPLQVHQRPYMKCHNGKQLFPSTTFCAGFAQNHSGLQVTEGSVTSFDGPHRMIVTNVTDHGTSGGPCTDSLPTQLLGVIVSDFGVVHHRTQIIPYLDVDNFLALYNESVPQLEVFPPWPTEHWQFLKSN